MSDTPVVPDRDAPPGSPTAASPSPLAGEETIRVVAAWLEAERERYRALAKARGIPEAIEIHETHGVITDSSRYTGKSRTVSLSSMSSEDLEAKIDQDVGAQNSVISLARDLYAAYGERCKVFAATRLEDNPVGFVTHTLVAPLRQEYLCRLESLGRGQPELARALASDLTELLESTQLRFVCWLPLSGFRISSDSVRAGLTTVRPLTSGEIGALHGGAMDLRSRVRHLHPYSHSYGFEDCALEIRTSQPKAEWPYPVDHAKAVVLALQLLGFEPHGRGNALGFTEPRRPFGLSGITFHLPTKGTTRDLCASDLQEALALAERIPPQVFANPTKRGDIALQRFHQAANNDSPVAALVDYTIALEGLLLESGGELTFRLQILGALFVGRSSAERFEVRRDLAQIYKLRSTLVHGRAVAPAEANRAAEKARRIAAVALVKALREGLPDEDALLAFAFADKVTP